MIVVVGFGVILAVLAFALIPLLFAGAAKALTRWLTGRK